MANSFERQRFFEAGNLIPPRDLAWGDQDAEEYQAWTPALEPKKEQIRYT
jgi:hypothetical protein